MKLFSMVNNIVINAAAAACTTIWLMNQMTVHTTPTTHTTPTEYTPTHAAMSVQLRDEGYTISHSPMEIDIASKVYWQWICNGGSKPTQEQMDMAIFLH